MGGEAVVNNEGYIPPPDFEENTREALIDLQVTDSTELWLIQMPSNLVPDFDGKELTLKLHRDGKLGTLEGSSGKEYDLVSYAAQEPDATVFMTSSSASKIAGKVSRRVSLVRYPDPDEVEKLVPHNPRLMYQRSSMTSLTNGSRQFSSPLQRTMLQNSLSARGGAASTRSSRPRSNISEPEELLKELKRDLASKSNSDTRNNAESSGHSRTQLISGSLGHGGGHSSSGVSSGPVESSHRRSSKKRKGGE